MSGDFNNDGDFDLVMPSYYAGQVSILLGNGHGGFGEPTLFDVGNYPRSIAVGDFNEDGNLDVAAANQGDYSPNALPSVGVLIGKGDGAFDPVIPISTEGSASSVAVGDFNKDGHLDLWRWEHRLWLRLL